MAPSMIELLIYYNLWISYLYLLMYNLIEELIKARRVQEHTLFYFITVKHTVTHHTYSSFL